MPIAAIFKQHGLEPETLLREAISTGKAAGSVIMGYYEAGAHNKDSIGIEIKSDNSPVTDADKASSRLIETRLKQLTPDITVVSEENSDDVAPEDPHWAIDPLDGTKLFINRTGGFAVNIALILDSQPVLGVVYCPAFKTLYYSYEGSAAYRQTGKLPAQEMKTRTAPKRNLFKKGDLKTLFDSAHGNTALYEAQREAMAQRNLLLPADPDGIRTLPQNMIIAEGRADIHVKTGSKGSGGFPWDLAADHIILKNAGGVMVDTDNMRPLRFDTARGRMPPYIAIGDKALGKKIFPELEKHCL